MEAAQAQKIVEEANDLEFGDGTSVDSKGEYLIVGRTGLLTLSVRAQTQPIHAVNTAFAVHTVRIRVECENEGGPYAAPTEQGVQALREFLKKTELPFRAKSSKHASMGLVSPVNGSSLSSVSEVLETNLVKVIASVREDFNPSDEVVSDEVVAAYIIKTWLEGLGSISEPNTNIALGSDAIN